MTTSTSRRPRAAPLPPAQRRAAILGAVAPHVIEHGPDVTSKLLAEWAGVSEGTIFKVFDDKDELLQAVIDATLDPQPLEDALATIDPSLAFEARLIAATAILQRRTMEVWKVLAAFGSRTSHPRPHQIPASPTLTAIFKSQSHRLRVAPAEAARRLRAVTVALTHPMMYPKPASPAEIVDTFLHGVARR